MERLRRNSITYTAPAIRLISSAEVNAFSRYVGDADAVRSHYLTSSYIWQENVGHALIFVNRRYLFRVVSPGEIYVLKLEPTRRALTYLPVVRISPTNTIRTPGFPPMEPVSLRDRETEEGAL